jgi:hypothetical protein
MQVPCPHCGRLVRASEEARGQGDRCPACHGAVALPAPLGVPTAQQPSAKDMKRLNFEEALSGKAAKLRRRWALPFLLLVLGAAVCAVILMRGRRPVPPWSVSATLPSTWGIAELQEHLTRQGMPLRRVSCAGNHDSERCALLTETQHSREVLGALSCDPRQLERWEGTVKVWREDQPLDDWERASGCWLLAPPFRLFGPPEMLAKVKAALEK